MASGTTRVLRRDTTSTGVRQRHHMSYITGSGDCAREHFRLVILRTVLENTSGWLYYGLCERVLPVLPNTSCNDVDLIS